MRILGLDPGSRHTGYGLIDKRGSALAAVAFGRFTAPNQPLPHRLAFFSAELRDLLVREEPDAAALETPFQGLNPRSLIVLAQTRGALLAVLAEGRRPIREYTPAEVKAAVSGYGRADKAQVAAMVRRILALGSRRLSADAADALAVAICCAQTTRYADLEGGAGSSRRSPAS